MSFLTIRAKKWTFTKTHHPGRPPISAELTNLILKLDRENRSWGYDRIVGVLKSLNHVVSHQTVANILKANSLDLSPERKRKTTWNEFIKRHRAVLWATDSFVIRSEPVHDFNVWPAPHRLFSFGNSFLAPGRVF